MNWLPGPWRVEWDNGFPDFFDANNECIIMPLDGVSKENARLIAAAPALYEALKEAEAFIGRLTPGAPDIHRQIIDALEMAEGCHWKEWKESR